jgi:colicin import membrane protein
MEQLSPEVKARIFAAAETLYDEKDRDSFPTVDAVRRRAKVNMNDASLGMKEWRKAQLAGQAEAPVIIPDAIQQSGLQLLGSIWQLSQEMATEGLRAAQHVWENERQELETIQAQISSAFEDTEAELVTVKDDLSTTANDLSETRSLNATLHESLRLSAEQNQSLKDRGADLLRRAEVAEGRCEEINRLATELRSSLDRAHEETSQKNQELTLAAKNISDAADRESELNKEVSKLMAALAAKDQEIKDLRYRTEDQKMEILTLHQQLDEQKAVAVRLESELAAARELVEGQKTEILTLHQQLDEQKAVAVRLESELAAARELVEGQKTEISTLHQQISEQKTLEDKLLSDLEKAQLQTRKPGKTTE